MVFNSILWPDKKAESLFDSDPDFFADLNLDMIIDGITSGYTDYNLRPFFITMPRSLDTVKYRQEIFKDLLNSEVFALMKDFSEKMNTIYKWVSTADRLGGYQKQGWLLEAALFYFNTMADFSLKLDNLDFKSQGLLMLREYLRELVHTDAFIVASREANTVKSLLSAIRYEMLIESSKVTIRRDKGKDDYNEIVKKLFDKFTNRNATSKSLKRFYETSMNQVEAAVLELIARLFPEEFKALSSFYENHKNFIDPTTAQMYRELQFYLSYIEYISPLEKTGLKFCIPEVGTVRDIYCIECFDLALAQRLLQSGSVVIANDFRLSRNENIIVVTGPNSGGKTTFARSIGQVFFLAMLGLPIPGSKAKLFQVDNIYTHFEKSEDLENLRGKLEDDLIRMRKILDSATERSLIIINEMLSSTASKDAISIGTKIIDLINKKNSICVYVTFFEELARIRGVISMVSQVDPIAPEIRTFRVVRSDPNGLAYATAIAERYGLTYKKIIERVRK